MLNSQRNIGKYVMNEQMHDELLKMYHSDTISSVTELITGGVKFREIRMKNEQVKETFNKFIVQYWSLFAKQVFSSLLIYGFVLVSFRRVKVRTGKDLKTQFETSDVKYTTAEIPYVPMISEVNIFYKMVDGIPECHPEFKETANTNKKIKMFYGNTTYDFDKEQQVYMSPLYDLYSVYKQYCHSEQHIMTVLSLNANPPLYMELSSLSSDAARRNEKEESQAASSRYPVEFIGGRMVDVDSLDKGKFFKNNDSTLVYKRTVEGEVVDPTDNVRQTPIGSNFTQVQPRSAYVFNDVNVFRIRLIESIASRMGVPLSFVRGLSTRVSAAARNDKVHLLETRIMALQEVEHVMNNVWADYYKHDDVQFEIPMFPVLDLHEVMEMASNGMIKDKSLLQDLYFQLTGARMNIDIPTIEPSSQAPGGGGGSSSKRPRVSESPSEEEE